MNNKIIQKPQVAWENEKNQTNGCSQQPERHYGNVENLGQNTAPNIHKFWKTEEFVINREWGRNASWRRSQVSFPARPEVSQSVWAKVHADIWSTSQVWTVGAEVKQLQQRVQRDGAEQQLQLLLLRGFFIGSALSTKAASKPSLLGHCIQYIRETTQNKQ